MKELMKEIMESSDGYNASNATIHNKINFVRMDIPIFCVDIKNHPMAFEFWCS